MEARAPPFDSFLSGALAARAAFWSKQCQEPGSGISADFHLLETFFSGVFLFWWLKGIDFTTGNIIYFLQGGEKASGSKEIDPGDCLLGEPCGEFTNGSTGLNQKRRSILRVLEKGPGGGWSNKLSNEIYPKCSQYVPHMYPPNGQVWAKIGPPKWFGLLPEQAKQVS